MLSSSKLFGTQPLCGSVEFRSWLEPCAVSGLSQQQPNQLIFSKDATWKTVAPSIFMTVFFALFLTQIPGFVLCHFLALDA